MDEQLWLCGTPHQMLSVLRRLNTRLKRPIDTRKMRFFALNCCRHAWPALIEERSRRAVEVAERELVGLASAADLAAAVEEAAVARDILDAIYTREQTTANFGATIAARVVAWVVTNGFDQGIFAKVRDSLLFRGVIGSREETRALVARLTVALRDVYGNPFRPVAFAPEWRTDTALSLARTMYESGEFSAMPILADALQDAGCDNEDVLKHCRAPGGHVRGCWVVDGVMGKG